MYLAIHWCNLSKNVVRLFHSLGLANAHGGAGPHEIDRGWFAAIVGLQSWLVIARTIEELAIDRLVQGYKLMPGFGLETSIVTNHHLPMPVGHNDDVYPAQAIDHASPLGRMLDFPSFGGETFPKFHSCSPLQHAATFPLS